MKESRREAALTQAVVELRTHGWKVVRLGGRIPDAIAYKDGELVAVKTVRMDHRTGKGRRVQSGRTLTQVKADYSMFDDVLLFTFDSFDETGTQ